MKRSLLISLLWLASQAVFAQSDISLSSKQLKVQWAQEKDGWHISSINAGGKTLANPSGAFTIIYLNRKPAAALVDQDIEGKAYTFYPATAKKSSDGTITFTQELRFGTMESTWKIDPLYPTDIHVEIVVKAKLRGSFSIGTPTVAVLEPNNLSWGMIPGNWYGREIQTDVGLATKYSMGLPSVPALAKERNTMTLSPMLTTKNKVTLAVIPDPGTGADSYEKDAITKGLNKVAMSTMDRHNQLTPVAYAPVLGQVGSLINPDEVLKFGFRYSIQAADWFPVFTHAVNDIYQFSNMLNIQQEKRSLSERVSLMQDYLQNDKKSNWTTWECKGLQIGANGQKNADVGSFCMLAYAGNNPVMQKHLPFVRNYKLAIQETDKGFFYGGAMGEYADEDGVGSERGNWVEPLYTTYYTLMDMGNMLLFKPNDPELRERVKLAADRLIGWQHPDGGFDVAYDRVSHQLSFPDLQDLRPTWYGLLIAYRILGDQKYLDAAKKGADWLVKNAVDKGYYLGVCGDARNIWDFATAQCSESLLELYKTTKNDYYKNAAIEAAKIYATSIFTQPIATTKIKKVGNVERQDWEIAEAGLSVEHIKGTASGGPILISSFTGLFTRMFEMTNDSLFLHMARVAARGRDAYVDAENGQSIYYWSALDNVARGAKVFPHHAFWQIGWITDYLMSEAHLRSGGKIDFPSGFMTPKVGPHVSYGFAPGDIYGNKADLCMPVGLLKSENANFEYLGAVGVQKDKLYVLVLNQSPLAQSGSVAIDVSKIGDGKITKLGKSTVLQGDKISANPAKGNIDLKIKPWGMSVVAIDLTK